MTEPPKISAIMIARNEATAIRWALESLRPWCDEIVVVDMHSDDETRAIASEYTEHVYLHERIPQFDQARAFAAAKTTNEWLMILDADEMVPHTLANHLVSVATRGKYDVVEIPFSNYLLGRRMAHTGWWPDYHIRFGRKSMLRLGTRVHATVGARTGASVLTLPPKEELSIVHINYHHVAEFVERLNHYTTLHLSDAVWSRRRTSLWRLPLEFAAGFGGRYIIRQGFRDGAQGLVLSLLMGVYRMVLHMKVWERQSGLGEAAVDEVYMKVRRATIDGFRSAAECSGHHE
jgi:glycosyltransferase involved in cell wall biosynthesis